VVTLRESRFDLSIVIVGAAGEGIQTIGDVVARSALAAGNAVFSTKEYESRIRGGHNSYWIRVREAPGNAPRQTADVLLALNDRAMERYVDVVEEDGLLIAETGEDSRTVAVSFRQIAAERFGAEIYANTIAAGALIATLGIKFAALAGTLAATFAAKGEKIVATNIAAAQAGYELAESRLPGREFTTLPNRGKSHFLISAHEVIPLAAAYAGCRFMSAYPMSPSTGIITAFAKDEGLGVFVEQAEDEIAAINMAIGASYAGARAMTATSGGGFALMTEAISLAGMIETPLVIVLAQRPGPATGLPTRTAQEDLLFAIHAGHGEFAKAVLAPSDPQETFGKTVRAFELADKYQIPVILLTDQFLADSHFSYKEFNLEKAPPTTYLAEPSAISDYKRYQLTADGVSPRLYPGQSEHLVCIDSDEHDETGHITEDLTRTRPTMVRKRLSKLEHLKKEIVLPEEAYLDDAQTVLVGWGSTRGAIMEAVERLRTEGYRAGMIHFTELWPLPNYTFPEGKEYIAVEGNATAQLARLLRGEYGVLFTATIHRYDGLPLSAQEIRRAINDRT